MFQPIEVDLTLPYLYLFIYLENTSFSEQIMRQHCVYNVLKIHLNLKVVCSYLIFNYVHTLI